MKANPCNVRKSGPNFGQISSILHVRATLVLPAFAKKYF